MVMKRSGGAKRIQWANPISIHKCDNRGRAVFVVTWYDEQGRRRRLSRASEAAAEEEMRAIEQRLRRGQPVDVTLSLRDREVLARAKNILKPYGVSLDHAVAMLKNVTIDVPPTGKSIEFVLRKGASSGQAVIVVSDDVEIRQRPETAKPAASNVTMSKNPMIAPTPGGDKHAVILKRLIKLRPTKRSTAVNSIKAMFQFDTPITDEAANDILDDLAKRGHLTINAKKKIIFRS
jgi:hypothetical protein